MNEDCICFRPGEKDCSFESAYLGEDRQKGRFADVTLLHCRICGSHWLRYAFTIEGISRSGRWYQGKLNSDQVRTVNWGNAAVLLESLPWYFCGGSYYDGVVGRFGGPIDGGSTIQNTEEGKNEEDDDSEDMFYPF